MKHTPALFRAQLLLVVLLIITSLVLSPLALAQVDEESAPPVPTLPPQPAAPENTVNCFDYYSFGSVQVDVAPIESPAVTAIPLPFAGKIKNANPYPIVDGQVYMKVFKREQKSASDAKQNGYPLTDFVLVKDNIVLPANSEQDISFEWTVPEFFAVGEYEAGFFFTSAKRYNLLGLTFTDDVVGNRAPFTVVSGNETSPVTFDKNSVFLNDTKFRFAAFPPHFGKDEVVTAYATVVNTSNSPRTVEVTWVTSKWDAIKPNGEVKRETFKVVLKPKESKKVEYVPPIVTDSSVTFMQAILKDSDAQSLLHIRFVRDGIDETRINFPGVMQYPLEAGKESTIFSCLHATNQPIVENSSLTLTLKDKNGDIIHTYTYTGGVTGAMMGVKDVFTPEKTLATFSLTATLKHNDEIVDEVTQTYDCTQIDPSKCVPDTVLDVVTDEPINMVTIIVIVSLLLALLGAVIVYRKRNALPETPMINPTN